jgi:superfamily II DNA or RNA helicase|tara:strand:- start:23026 stop:24438 length:1413 start_codon:yes stop_codon:yes gene_type:complete
VNELRDYFSFFVPGHKFMPAFKKRVWDGKIRLFNSITRELNVGLWSHIKKFSADRMYPLQIEDNDEFGHPEKKNVVSHPNLVKYLSTIESPFDVRDYQYDAISHGIENKRAILLSPTGSGKSFIIYNLMRWYMDNFAENVLIVVPTTSLVEQMYKDFYEYGFDVENNCHRIYSGKDKVTNKRVIISTWQSIYKFPQEFFEQFHCIFGDEVHLFKAKSLSGIMNKARNAEYRFGTTGTLDGTETNKLVLEGLFGPTKRVTATRDLQEKGTLAKIDISVLLLRYHNDICHMMQGKTYQEEIDYIVTHEKRNKFITNLTLDQTGNTLVLFQFVEKHGKILFDMMKDKIAEGRKIFYVSGEVDAKDREQIRGIVESQKDAIIVASMGTFSTGINIRNLNNIVFASPSKSQIRVLQSIGRGLRKSDNGKPTKLFDIADDMHVKSHKNFTLRHSGERIKIYSKEQFPYKIYEVNLK